MLPFAYLCRYLTFLILNALSTSRPEKHFIIVLSYKGYNTIMADYNTIPKGVQTMALGTTLDQLVFSFFSHNCLPPTGLKSITNARVHPTCISRQ